VLYLTGIHRLLAPFSQGIGLIFMLHRVSPEPQGAFSPNKSLMVTAEYLDCVLQQVAESGIEIVTLDDA
jgi:hypothetical protein